MSLYNSEERCVDEMLHGVVTAHPGLRLDADKRVVWHDDQPDTVAVISGGGSGHEPFAAGYVGRGMLTAAVAGSVFASPPAASITSSMRRVTLGGTRDILVVIPNYTGDCLNFGLAVEKARTSGQRVCAVTVGEDCALDAQQSAVGRRGLCGLVLVFKVLGYMSSSGASLERMTAEAELLVRSMATLGLGLSACQLPGASAPLFSLPPGSAELGLGVHGEAGSASVKLETTNAAVTLLLHKLSASLALTADDEVCVLINNLGGSSQLEQWVFCNEVVTQLKRRGVAVRRTYVGAFMTSLDMRGFQICILKPPVDKRSDWLRCLDADTDAPAWPGGRYSRSPPAPDPEPIPSDYIILDHTDPGTRLTKDEVERSQIARCLTAAARDLIANQGRLNQLDSGCGDGDTGSTLARLAQEVLDQIQTLAGNKPSVLLCRLAALAESKMGGTSGALYSLMLTTAGAAMTEHGHEDDWTLAFSEGLAGVMKYSNARVGDRTMLDALVPACTELSTTPRGFPALARAVAAAREGCDSTANMTARAGRASYVGALHITDVDAGAFAVVTWLSAIYRVLGETEQVALK